MVVGGVGGWLKVILVLSLSLKLNKTNFLEHKSKYSACAEVKIRMILDTIYTE